MTTTSHGAREHMIVTASLTSGIACVAHGITGSVKLIDEILRMDHLEWETILSVGTVEFHSSKAGPAHRPAVGQYIQLTRGACRNPPCRADH